MNTLSVLTDLPLLRYKLWLRWHRLDYKPNTVEELGLDPAVAHPNAMSGGPHLERVLRTLDIPHDARCIDFGCGKGIAALTLAKYFNLVVGVDLSPLLIEVARLNADKVNAVNAVFFQDDARDAWLDYDTYAYAFNPFPAAVMAQVSRNIIESVDRIPRKFTFIYKAPFYGDELLKAGFHLPRIFEFRNDHPVHVYTVGEPTAQGQPEQDSREACKG